MKRRGRKTNAKRSERNEENRRGKNSWKKEWMEREKEERIKVRKYGRKNK